jgi:hypothetical protein
MDKKYRQAAVIINYGRQAPVFDEWTETGKSSQTMDVLRAELARMQRIAQALANERAPAIRAALQLYKMYVDAPGEVVAKADLQRLFTTLAVDVPAELARLQLEREPAESPPSAEPTDG